MKVAIVLAIARYYHNLNRDRVSHILGILGVIVLIVLPAQFVLQQPDLGTTLLLTMTTLCMVFLAGINWRVISAGVVTAAVAVPLFIRFGLKDYQRRRIMTFFDPSIDPTGAGYQSKDRKMS